MTFETEQMGCLVCGKAPLTVEVDKAGNLYVACGKCQARMPATEAQRQRAEREALRNDPTVPKVARRSPATLT